MMGRPMVARAFELAERLGGMTAFELMGRMSVEELRLWGEYDRRKALREAEVIPLSSYQVAAILAKLDWIKGCKQHDGSRYLPKIQRPRRMRTLAQIKANFDCAVANSARLKSRIPAKVSEPDGRREEGQRDHGPDPGRHDAVREGAG